MNIYKKGVKLEYNNNIFQTVIGKDNKIGFFKITTDGKYVFPTAIELLHLNSYINPDLLFKFN